MRGKIPLRSQQTGCCLVPRGGRCLMDWRNLFFARIWRIDMDIPHNMVALGLVKVIEIHNFFVILNVRNTFSESATPLFGVLIEVEK